MKKASLVVQSPYNNGEIFRKESPLNRDDCLVFFHELKNIFLENNILLNTSDIHAPDESDYVIYNEMPKSMPNFNPNASLLIFESELIRPDNWDKSKHAHFGKVFTWNDTFVDNKKYFKFCFTHQGSTRFLTFKEKTHFCSLIAGNKKVEHPLELYSKRIEAIRWFEAKHPEDFHLFGIGWDQRPYEKKLIQKILKRIPIINKIGSNSFPSYQGPVSSKIETLKNYKFSICYENARDIPGYITEKIFDSLAAGCIPVYWGAPEVSQLIPSECFIDKRQFESYEDLFKFLKNISKAEYNSRLEAIEQYLKSEKHLAFTPHACAKKVIGDIMSLS